jgi:large subunit ribosomal protein L15
MKYNELQLTRQKKPKRVGRGISAGRGKTAGRGTKGQGARKSGGVRPGFEGGQMPLYMRLPKLRGFKSHRPKPQIVYTGQIDAIKKSQIDNFTLFEAGLMASPYQSAKLLFKGELKSKKTVRIQAASASAVEAITKAGGSFEAIERQPRTKQKIVKDPISKVS